MTVIERSRPLRVSTVDSRLCNSKGGDANVSSRIGCKNDPCNYRRNGFGSTADLGLKLESGDSFFLCRSEPWCTSLQ
jgi:hypothetical protein